MFTDAERAALEQTVQGTRIADAAGGVTDEARADAAKHYDEECLADPEPRRPDREPWTSCSRSDSVRRTVAHLGDAQTTERCSRQPFPAGGHPDWYASTTAPSCVLTPSFEMIERI